MSHENSEGLYKKYRILDAVTGEEKKGDYFVLKLDTADDKEFNAVRAAIAAYACAQYNHGNIDLATALWIALCKQEVRRTWKEFEKNNLTLKEESNAQA